MLLDVLVVHCQYAKADPFLTVNELPVEPLIGFYS